MTDFATALQQLWPNGDERIPGLRTGIIAAAPAAFAKYGINALALAHLMAQISHECGAGHDVVENLNYTATRLIEVWPRHFNRNNAADYAHNPQKLANFIYNPPQHNDLGNRAGSQDGWLYRGRGGVQTTGRDAYTKLAKLTGLELVANPDLVNDPKHFLDCAIADFIQCGCLPYAKRDDLLNVTKKLNGGTVGLDQRQAWLRNWKRADVQVPVATGVAPVPPSPSQPLPLPQQPGLSLLAKLATLVRGIFPS